MMDSKAHPNSVTTSDLREFVDILQFWSEKGVHYKMESAKALMYDRKNVDAIVEAIQAGKSVTLTVDEERNLTYQING